ncbi:MAG: DUF4148 domain-containing protein [Burkholderiaceae bacterium]|nr:DUF4148 domain-containing protein [Burkholderiaceae bacterium]
MRTEKPLTSLIAIAALLAPAIAAAANTANPGRDGSRAPMHYAYPSHTGLQASRERVIDELREAKAVGLIVHGEQGYPPETPTAMFKTREEVRTELEAAKAAGLMSFGELGYPPGTSG